MSRPQTNIVPVDEDGHFYALQPYEVEHCPHDLTEKVPAEPSVGIYGDHEYCQRCGLADEQLWRELSAR